MSGATSIEWTDVTWNPVRGCSRVSEGCRHCYAELQAARFSGAGELFDGFAERKLVVLEDREELRPRWTGKVELIPEKLEEPLRWRKPRRIFVNSMSDLFHERLSDEAIASVFGVMAACPQHTFQVLTKRPDRMREWTSSAAGDGGLSRFYAAFNRGVSFARSKANSVCPDWPLPNVWLGVSVENQETANERIPLLLQTPAALRFVSYEPALRSVDFRYFLPIVGPDHAGVGDVHPDTSIDWLIVGGESGPGARPCDLAWVRSAVKQCREARVPVFVKQIGSRPIGEPWVKANGKVVTMHHHIARRGEIVLSHPRGGDPSEWPEDLRRVLREMPGGAG